MASTSPETERAPLPLHTSCFRARAEYEEPELERKAHLRSPGPRDDSDYSDYTTVIHMFRQNIATKHMSSASSRNAISAYISHNHRAN